MAWSLLNTPPMMKRAFLLMMVCLGVSSLRAERVALVMGNNRYDNLAEAQQLQSPVADAVDVAAGLKKLGYKVVSDGALTNATRERMITAIEEFTGLAKNAEAAIFYFSGHGVQMGEEQFLIPSDTPPLTAPSILTNRAVKLRESVMVALEEQQARTKIMILDCCRDNPFSAQLDRALAQVGKSMRTKSLGEITGYGPGFYLAFATSPGTTASDGNGRRNSPFTAAMLESLQTSVTSDDIDFFFRDVKSRLGQEQVSWTNHSMADRFCLAISAGGSPAVADAGAMGELERLKREVEALKRQQSQVNDSPPATMTSPSPQDTPPGALPPDLPEKGFFERPELFAQGPYADFNTYSQTQILKRAQETLKKEGFYTGITDGIRGPGTQSALHAWQQARGLRVSGRLDSTTVQKLGLTGIQQMTPPPAPTKPASNIASTIQKEEENRAGAASAGSGLGRPSTTTSQPTATSAVPVAEAVPGKPGYYYSPTSRKIIDARDLRPGSKAKDPQTGEIFRLPGSAAAPVVKAPPSPAASSPPLVEVPRQEMTDEEFFRKAEMLRKR